MNSKLLLALFALLLVNTYSQTCFGIAANNTAVCRSHGSCVATDFCNCFSGYDGSQCENQASNTACTWNTNTQTKTDFYPVIDTTSLDFVQDNLIFSIKAPIVTDRLDSVLYLGDDNKPECKFPGSVAQNVLDLNAPCFNRYNFKLPWASAKNCAWKLQETSDELIYTGNLYIKQLENIGYIRGAPIQRSILRVIPLEVRFKTLVSVSTSVKVFSPINMFAAITKQAYLAGPPASGLFEFETSLQYPFVIDTKQAFSVTDYPSGLIASISDISVSQECLPNQACTQRFRIPLTINGACSFTGDYTSTFKLACHPSITNPANCPIDPNNNNARVVISANSENFCTAATVDIKLSGTLQSYSDNTYKTIKNAYLMDQTSFFQALISSPKATLKSSAITRVQWSAGNLTRVLFDGSAITTEGTREQFALGPNGAYTAAFKFLLSPQWMDVPEDLSRDFNVSAVVKVQYEAIDGTTANKLFEQTWNVKNLGNSFRSVQADEKSPNSQDSKYSSAIQVFGAKASTSAAGTMQFSVVLSMLVGILYWVL